MKLFRTLAIILSTTIFLGHAQAQELTEDQVPLGVQSYLYTHYPSSSNVKWSVRKNEEGTKFYQATLDFNTEKVTAVLAKDGVLVYEDIEYTASKSPIHIVDYAASNYDKFKIVGVHKHTNFAHGTNTQTKVNYELVVKVNKEESIVWFDEGMYRHDKFETSSLAIK